MFDKIQSQNACKVSFHLDVIHQHLLNDIKIFIIYRWSGQGCEPTEWKYSQAHIKVFTLN